MRETVSEDFPHMMLPVGLPKFHRPEHYFLFPFDEHLSPDERHWMFTSLNIEGSSLRPLLSDYVRDLKVGSALHDFLGEYHHDVPLVFRTDEGHMYFHYSIARYMALIFPGSSLDDSMERIDYSVTSRIECPDITKLETHSKQHYTCWVSKLTRLYQAILLAEPHKEDKGVGNHAKGKERLAWFIIRDFVDAWRRLMMITRDLLLDEESSQQQFA